MEIHYEKQKTVSSFRMRDRITEMEREMPPAVVRGTLMFEEKVRPNVTTKTSHRVRLRSRCSPSRRKPSLKNISIKEDVRIHTGLGELAPRPRPAESFPGHLS